MMAELLASGRLVDVILAIVALEAVAITAYRRFTGKGIAPRDLFPNLIAGAFLLLAVRMTLTGFGWEFVCASLAAAGIASAIDIAMRWRN